MKKLLAATLFLAPLPAAADPFNLTSESGFLFDFYPSTSANLSNGTWDAYDGCYTLTIEGTAFDAGNRAHDDFYDGRGFRTQTDTIGDLIVQRFGYVPALGLSFARYIDVVQNTGDADTVVTFSYYCNLGSDGWQEAIDSSDGDAQMEITDDWTASDDGTDDGGDPSLAHVLQQSGADAGMATMAYNPGSMTWTYDVAIPAGGQAAIMIFAVQEQTRELARAAALSLAELEGEAIEAAEDEIYDVVNFQVGPAGAPRLHANGPYAVQEGGTVDLDIDVVDPDGDAVSFSWDLDDDGTFGDLPDDPGPTIDAADADGPGTLHVGIELSDGVNTVDRRVSIRVDNVAPAVSSTPPATATTAEEYSYQIAATDVPADTISYRIEQGPVGMTVSAAGLVEWTPPNEGLGPSIPVVVVVSDEDGGELEHAWQIEMHGAPTLVTGGPYEVAEGGEVLLAPVVVDPEGEDVTFAWDLDGDGVYDDSTEPTAIWSAAGIDGPAEGFIVRLAVSDGTYDVTASIPVSVENAPPQFVSEPAETATVDRAWTYAIQVIDPGDDAVVVTVEEEDLPAGMTFDAATLTLGWTPNAGSLVEGEPPGHYAFTITAEDDDRSRSRQDVSITITQNAPPPVPPIKYPDGDVVRTPQPTILLENVVDPDGDPVLYFLEADYNPCFCSDEHMASGGLPQGDLVTQWTLPRPFNVDPEAGGHTTFYLRRWAHDGLADSARELSLFDYAPPEGGDGDADSDSDADGGVSETRTDARCACRMAPARPSLAGPAAALFACLALAARRMRRRR